MTVEEAKTKTCPFIQSQYAFIEGRGLNDMTLHPANINCICGDCMSWQYTKETSDEIETKTFDGIKKTRNKPLLENEKEGYCKRLHQ